MLFLGTPATRLSRLIEMLSWLSRYQIFALWSSNMAQLTPREYAFCHYYVYESLSLGQAYRRAFTGKKYSNALSHYKANALAKRVEVAQTIESMRKRIGDVEAVNLGQHVAKLREIREKALDSKRFGDAVKAEIAIGQVAGFYRDKPAGDTQDAQFELDHLLSEIKSVAARSPMATALLPVLENIVMHIGRKKIPSTVTHPSESA